jgi:hypothetical protein
LHALREHGYARQDGRQAAVNVTVVRQTPRSSR